LPNWGSRKETIKIILRIVIKIIKNDKKLIVLSYVHQSLKIVVA